MGRIYDAALAWFEEDDWSCDADPERAVIVVGVKGRNHQWRCVATCSEELEVFRFYSLLVPEVPGDQRARIGEFINRANYGLQVGCFEIDYSDGEIRLRTSVDLEGTSEPAPLIQQVVHANVSLADRFYPGIMAVLHADVPPVDALERVKASQ